MNAKSSLVLVCIALMPAGAAFGETQLTQRGITGLIDTPTAFMPPDGQVGITYGKDPRRDATSLSFQALPRLETSLSFSTYDDIGDGSKAEDSSYNLKYLIFDETPLRPSIAIGINGVFGNDRDSAEYIVASKMLSPQLNASLGLGWGRLGGGADVDAPFGTRPDFVDDNSSGVDALFRGDAGVFGGLSWATPVDGVSLLLEYSSDTFENEARPISEQLNYGIRYQAAEGLGLLAYARSGEDLGVMLSFYGNPNVPRYPPNLRDGPPLVEPRAAVGRDDLVWASDAERQQALLTDLAQALARNQISMESYATDGTTIRIGVRGRDEANVAKVVGRTARVLSSMAPASVTQFEVIPFSGGLATDAVQINRDRFVGFADQPDASLDAWHSVTFESAVRNEAGTLWSAPVSTGFTWALSPAVVVDITSDDAFEPLAKLFARGTYTFTEAISVSGTLGYQLNGNKTQSDAPDTPSARSDGGAYDRRAIQLEQLYANYFTEARPDIYTNIAFGLVERQYAAVTAELLWAPAGQNWALGADLSFAKKRDYDDAFGLIDYESVTGFGSLYWDTGFQGISTQIDVGRYLAGDWGTTLNLSRNFSNGWNVTTFTTVTEGNSDEQVKVGMSVSVPLSWLAPLATRRTSNIRLGGPTGEFGSKLAVPGRIYPRISQAGHQRLEDAWGDFWN